LQRLRRLLLHRLLLRLQRRRWRVVALLYRRRGHRLVNGDPAALFMQRATVEVALESVVVGCGLVLHRHAVQ